jgi:hypothetical protein
VDDHQTTSPQNSEIYLFLNPFSVPPPTHPPPVYKTALEIYIYNLFIYMYTLRRRAKGTRNFSSVAAGQGAAMKREQNGGDSVLDWGGSLSSIYVLYKP